MATAPTTSAPQVDESVDRRDLLLDAAIRVIAAQGLRGMTHRSVEAEAGVPHGSTTYYFGTRRDLVVALMHHIAERAAKQAAPITRGLSLMLADRSKPVDLDVIGDAMLAWIDSEAEMELARYELQITAARDPEMKRLASEICDQFRVMCEPIVIACGSKDVQRDSTIVQTAFDGWMYARLTHIEPDDETFKRGLKVLLGAIAND
jgi:DNA-binding transcriptional regulator YbjK